MKKIVTLCALTALAIPAMVNAQDAAAPAVYRLTDMTDSQNGENYNFYYDESGRLVRYDILNDIRARFEYEYDENGNCIKESIFQDIDMVHRYVPTAYIEYTYDEQGRIATRTNYNNFSTHLPTPVWEYQATIDYLYDENGRLVKKNTYRGEDRLLLHQDIAYVYNDKGLLAEENETNYNIYSTDHAVSKKGQVVYTYDEENRLLDKCALTSEDQDVNTLRVRTYTICDYDEDGILTEIYTTGSSKDPRAKMSSFVYTVDETVPVAQVRYPVAIPEPYYDTNTIFPAQQPYQIIEAKEYVQGKDAGDESGMICDHDWTYNYEEVGPLQIVNMGMAGRSLAAATVVGDVLHLIGVNHASDVTITDLNGRTVKSLPLTDGTISVAGLQNGVYVLSCRQGSVKFVR